MIGRCPAILALRDKLTRFARVPSSVLIRGESGTGKDLVARILHQLGPRAKKPMVAENCAAIPETLLESVLFGHARGAFTGAVRDHDGHFVAAHGGTLFLDEIGDTSPAMQSKLLRALQEGEIRPVGSEKVRKVDVRVIAATNRDLEQLVTQGKFRQDLFYRLNVLQLWLPPLRERGEDIVLLARRVLADAARRAGRTLRFSAAAEAVLLRARWPGNVRQLQNEAQRLAALADGPEVGPADLSPELRTG
ncbi:MAG: sigma-54-dependent Fis family transcriptional regulator [Planctomycetes bacterium]|nr:sigma-54-dependent Fis family transcriptional regulator [Planctomycetota bacterium]